MKETTKRIYEELFERYPVLSGVKESVRNAFEMIKSTYENGGTLYATPHVQMTIPKSAANKAGAYAFLQYALSDEVQCSERMAARAMPVTRAAYEAQIDAGYYSDRR